MQARAALLLAALATVTVYTRHSINFEHQKRALCANSGRFFLERMQDLWKEVTALLLTLHPNVTSIAGFSVRYRMAHAQRRAFSTPSRIVQLNAINYRPFET
jgi:hypothetical protein